LPAKIGMSVQNSPDGVRMSWKRGGAAQATKIAAVAAEKRTTRCMPISYQFLHTGCKRRVEARHPEADVPRPRVGFPAGLYPPMR
jgi:hypothetical protein